MPAPTWTKIKKPIGKSAAIKATMARVPVVPEPVVEEPVIPPTPREGEYLTIEQVKERYDVDLEPGWRLRVRTHPQLGELYAYASPEGWEYERVRWDEQGNVIDYLAIDPEGTAHTKAELEVEIPAEPVAPSLGLRRWMEEELGVRRPVTEIEAIPSEVGELIAVAQADPDAFLDQLVQIGRTDETEELLRQFGANEEEIEEIFGPPDLSLISRIFRYDPYVMAGSSAYQSEKEWEAVSAEAKAAVEELYKQFPTGQELDYKEAEVELLRKYPELEAKGRVVPTAEEYVEFESLPFLTRLKYETPALVVAAALFFPAIGTIPIKGVPISVWEARAMGWLLQKAFVRVHALKVRWTTRKLEQAWKKDPFYAKYGEDIKTFSPELERDLFAAYKLQGSTDPARKMAGEQMLTRIMTELDAGRYGIPAVAPEVPIRGFIPAWVGGLSAKQRALLPMTPKKWLALPMPQRLSLIQAMGLSGRIASKAWEALTEAERVALTTKPELAPPPAVPEVAPPAVEVPKELAPLPAEPDVIGKQIAEATGLRYDGLQEGIGMQFTDTKVTGTTFYANTMEEARATLVEKRELFEKPPAVEAPPAKPPVAKPPVTKAEEVGRRIDELEAEVAGLKETLATDSVATARFTIGKKEVDLTHFISIKEQTFPEYFTVKQAQALWPEHDFSKYTKKGLPTYNKVPRDEALDDLTKQFNMSPNEIAGRVMEIRALRAKIKANITELQAELAEITKPLVPLPETTAKEAATNLAITGQPALTPAQFERTLTLFGEYVTSPSTESAWSLTQELRRETRALRAEVLKARVQKLIVEEGIGYEKAIKQAISETMAGELPVARADYFDDLTEKMKDALFSKVYHTLKDEPFEMMSTATALTNALQGKPIPREPGVRGGSAYTRLKRVFSPEVFEAIKKGARESKPIQSVIESLYMEVGKPPLPIDKEMADWLRSLAESPHGVPTLFDKPSTLVISDLRTPAELEYAKRKIELGTAFVKGEIDETRYRIELAEAFEKAFPIPPVTRYETPIEDVAKKIPLMPPPAKHIIVRSLKEVGKTAIDIGNFMRANMASFDASWWRQLAPFMFAASRAFAVGSVKGWHAIFSQEVAEASWARITRDPLFQIYEEGADFLRPLHLPKGTSQWRGVEEFGYISGERPIPRLAMKLPWIKRSERAFVTGINETLWLEYTNHYRDMLTISEGIASGIIKLGPEEVFSIEKEMIDFSKLLADFSGRAQLGRAGGLAPALSASFFAPRYKLGRFMTPKHLFSSNPRVRKKAWKYIMSFVGGMWGILLLGKKAGLWDVEFDSRSADFAKVRIGNIRVDPWGGFQQVAVFMARVITKTQISTITRAEYEIDPVDTITRLLESSRAPLAGLILDFWTGKTFLGDDVDITNFKQWVDRIAPFALMDAWEAFQEDPSIAKWTVIPSLVGFSTMAYTGDWVTNFANLGLPKYPSNLDYGLTEPVYDTGDFWSDTASPFKGVDPAELTKEKGYPEYIRSIARAQETRGELALLYNDKLISLNADPEEGPTFVQYYEMWQDREKLVVAGDDARYTVVETRIIDEKRVEKSVTYKGEEAVEAFDRDERTRHAFYGNISQREYALLVEYHSITDKIKQAEFLEEHPELEVNPRQEWLRTHPKENANLAIWGQAEVLTQEAYNETQRLIKELDIPDSTIEFNLPPEGSAESHFKYLEAGEEFGWNSWETQLILAQDDTYREWKGLDPVETPVGALELQIKHRELFEQYDTLETDEDRAKLKADNPEWVDDIRRIEAIKLEASDEIIDSWVERGKIVDEFTAGSSEAKVWLVDNKETWDWALAQDLLTDDGSDWNVPVLRINAQWREEDDFYDALPVEGDVREKYLAEHEDYRKDRRRRDAYGDDFPEGQIENYVEYYELPTKGFRQERFLVENPEFAESMHELKGIDLPDPEKVPAVQYDELYEEWQEDFDKLEGLSDHESPHYIEDKDERDEARQAMRLDEKGNLTEFGEAELEREAYGKFFPEEYVENYVNYYSILIKGKPEGQEVWYEDGWFLMENKDFYRIAKDLLEWQARDFSKVPSREVYRLYIIYTGLPIGQTRLDYRAQHLDLERWLVDVKGYTPIEDRGDEGADISRAEQLAEDIAEGLERIKALTE